MASKYDAYELSSLLNDVTDKGFLVIHLAKLWRLLGKGSRAAGTWRALLDGWEEARDGNERVGLHVCELPGEYILLTIKPTEPARIWAAEHAPPPAAPAAPAG